MTTTYAAFDGVAGVAVLERLSYQGDTGDGLRHGQSPGLVLAVEVATLSRGEQDESHDHGDDQDRQLAHQDLGRQSSLCHHGLTLREREVRTLLQPWCPSRPGFAPTAA
jgi:hypothetical protein